MELSSIYFSSSTVFHDISKQIQQRGRIGEIFSRWHLAIAIAVASSIFFPVILVYRFCLYASEILPVREGL